jgi:hypothetical protein
MSNDLSLEQQLIDAVLVRLNDVSRPEDVPECERATTDAIESEEPFRRMLIYPLDDDPDLSPHPVTRSTMRFVIEMRAAAEDGQPVDQAPDAMYRWCVQRLVRSDLGGIANRVMRSRSHNAYAKRDFAYAIRTTEFLIEYATPADDVTVTWGAH